MAGGEQPLRVHQGSAALEVSVPVQRRLPGPGTGRRALAAHHPAAAHVRVSIVPSHTYHTRALHVYWQALMIVGMATYEL